MASIFSLALTSSVQAYSCKPSGSGEQIAIISVYDGDTLTLKDGRKVRLLGINTPERGKAGAPDQPLAQEAKRAVENALKKAGPQADLRLYYGRERRDKYARHLAHITINGESLAYTLLEQGLAWHVVVPPNVSLAACFAAAEKWAQDRHQGLWQNVQKQFVRVNLLDSGGYQRVRGRVSKVSFADAWWINFDGNFTAVIYPENQHYFEQKVVANWQGKELEIEGWVYSASYRGKQQWRIKLATPYGMSVL